MNTKLLLFMVVWVMLVFGANIRAETVVLSAAASMTEVCTELAQQFATASPGVRIIRNFASSGSLAKQIAQGAPADIFVSANPAWMDYLRAEDLVSSENERIVAYNSLVFLGVDDGAAPIRGMAGLASLERIALGSPDAVPAGRYARQAMEHGGVYALLEASKKLILTKDVRQALLYADRGEVDGAFVYRTDALLATSARILFDVPETLYERISYPAALTVAGLKKEAARALFDFLTGPEATPVLARYGFRPAW